MLGVVFGDLFFDSVVLWMCLVLDLLNGGGMLNQVVFVKWEVVKDEYFCKIVRKGIEMVKLNFVYLIYVEVDGFELNKVYYYCFKIGYELSFVGKIKMLFVSGVNVL